MSDKAVSWLSTIFAMFVAILVLAPATCFSWYSCVWLLAHAKVMLRGG